MMYRMRSDPRMIKPIAENTTMMIISVVQKGGGGGTTGWVGNDERAKRAKLPKDDAAQVK